MGRRVAFSLALVLAASSAQGAGRVLTASDGTIFVSSSRVAIARAPLWTTQWLSLGVEGGPGRLVVVLPVAPGTRVDPSLEAFFFAIDGVTAPRIRPPKPVLVCGATHEGSLENTSSSPESSLAPSTIAVLDDLTQVGSFAIQQGVSLDNADVAALAATGAPRFVAVVYDLGQDKGISEPLRIAQPTASPSPHIALLASDASPDVTLFSIAEGRVGWVAGVEEIGASEVGNEWLSVDGISSYVQDRRTELLAKQGALSVVESSGSTPLFGWTVLPAGAGALAPGVKSYFEKAKKEVAGVSPSDLCVAPVWDAIAAGKTGARLARACAAGALVSVPDLAGAPACTEAPGAGEISVASLRCGGADDIAFALAGMRADLVSITRHATIAGPNSPDAAALALTQGPPVSLLVTAATQNPTGCTSGVGGGTASGGTTGGAGYGGDGAQGGYGASTGYWEPDPTPEPRVDVSCGVQFVESCNGSSSNGSDDGCSGDSSSDDGDTCGGDSTGAGDEGDTCAGDSTGNGDADTCGGDSGSGAEGDTCSGGDAGGGDSCGSGSSGGDCSIRSRPRRLRVSALFLLFSAVALPLRRLGRSRRSKR